MCDNSETINRSYYAELPGGHAGEGWDKLKIYYGAEMWTNGSQVAWRNRIKYVIEDPQKFTIWQNTD